MAQLSLINGSMFKLANRFMEFLILILLADSWILNALSNPKFFIFLTDPHANAILLFFLSPFKLD